MPARSAGRVLQLGGHLGGLAAECQQACAGFGRRFLLDDAAQFAEAGLSHLYGLEWKSSGDQLVKNHPERVHVASSVYVCAAKIGLFGAHVFRGADQLTGLGAERPFCQFHARGLGHAEVDHLGSWLPVIVRGDEYVRWFQIPVNDALHVGMLNEWRLYHEMQPLARIQTIVVTEFGDRNTFHVLHDEERPSIIGRPGVIDRRDIGMIQDGECLSLRLESRDDGYRVHSGLDDLQRFHTTTNGRVLFGQVDNAESTFGHGETIL